MSAKTKRLLAETDELQSKLLERMQKSRMGRSLSERDKEFLVYLRSDVLNSGDIVRMVEIERVFIEYERDFRVTSPAQASSLKNALACIAAIRRGIDKVVDPECYRREVDENYTLPKNRKGGLPNDEARQALASQFSRLVNADKSSLGKREKAFLEVRIALIHAAQDRYIALQKNALGLE